MNGPGGNRSRATAAYGSFPYPMRTVTAVDADARSKARAKEQYARHVLRQIEAEETAKLSHNIPHNLTYRDNRIPASHLPCAGRGLAIQRIGEPAPLCQPPFHASENAR